MCRTKTVENKREDGVLLVVCLCFISSLLPFLPHVFHPCLGRCVGQREGVVCVEKFGNLLVVVQTCVPGSVYVLVVPGSVVLCL